MTRLAVDEGISHLSYLLTIIAVCVCYSFWLLFHFFFFFICLFHLFDEDFCLVCHPEWSFCAVLSQVDFSEEWSDSCESVCVYTSECLCIFMPSCAIFQKMPAVIFVMMV